VRNAIELTTGRSVFDDDKMTRIDPIILMFIEIIVAQYTGVFSNIREKSRENKVLDDDITVTADMEVKSKPQLNRIPLIIEFSSIIGAILI
jgi:hypothetical protein